MSDLLISIKSKYSKLIYDGKKNVELRKVRLKEIDVGSRVYIYEPSPEQEITGFFTVKDVKLGSTSDIWTSNKYKLGTDVKEYWSYVGNADELYVIEIDKVFKFKKDSKLGYQQINSNYNEFNPPQSYLYIKGRYEWEEILNEVDYDEVESYR